MSTQLAIGAETGQSSPPDEERPPQRLLKVVSDSQLHYEDPEVQRQSSSEIAQSAVEEAPDGSSEPAILPEHRLHPRHQSSTPIDFERHAPRKARSAHSLPPVFRNQPAASTLVSSINININNAATNNPATASAAIASRKLYRAAESTNSNKWVTRDIAALDFLLNIPLQAEGEIVRAGYLLHQHQQKESRQSFSSGHPDDIEEEDDTTSRPLDIPVGMTYANNANSKGTWWEKWIKSTDTWMNNAQRLSGDGNTELLERPDASGPYFDRNQSLYKNPLGKDGANATSATVPAYVPGRRLEGDTAIRIHVPLTTDSWTRQKSIARQAALREWELATAHGLGNNQPPLLEGRLFFSASGSYPLSVCSVLRYEPKKEEAALRRQKLEARGGGGTHFFMPARDWRGISYRALLPRRVERNRKAFNRFLKQNYQGDAVDDDDGDNNKKRKSSHDKANESSSSGSDGDDSSTTSESSEDSDVYMPGLLDDPEMVLGRHHTVMMGDRVTGPIVSSTIQFVKPALLKVELNKQFRERFDGWEPPKSARKYIGARVVDGEYKLMDPAAGVTASAANLDDMEDRSPDRRPRQGSIAGSLGSESASTTKEKVMRMPPSLTLSKIRSLKQQALAAVVKAKVEISTLALACVYFERLCLDCRVDKSNRRLCFAACLLLASKLNEANSTLVMTQPKDQLLMQTSSDGSDKAPTRIQAMIRPNSRSDTMFASLLEFFTQDWNLSLKHLFDAEWGVFAALGFSLNATPSQVAFHFKRFMKILEWNPLAYLGPEMYRGWQSALADEEERRRAYKVRMERRRRRKERRLLNLHIELENELRRKTEAREKRIKSDDESDYNAETQASSPVKSRKSGISIFHRFGMRRITSQEKIAADISASTTEHSNRRKTIPLSPSMPSFPTNVLRRGGSTVEAHETPDEVSNASLHGSDNNSNDGIVV
jgi:Cyclin, N-terminal domain